jgi:pyruvate/2-oxoglutarate dehydrogenase complex dihydrolipoamide acyltransferase (E2) component
MDEAAVERALARIAEARESRADPAALEAALERARTQVESLAAATTVLQTGLPGAIQEGLREHFRPSARHLAEVRGLMNQMIRRIERLETDLLAERNARVDDLALLVDLITSGWRSANERLARIEAALAAREGATVYRIERPGQQAS